MNKEKLVRDNMPSVCAEVPGYTPMTFRVAPKQERLKLMFEKLKEEVDELQRIVYEPYGSKAEMVEEFADVFQVMMDLMNLTTATAHEVNEFRLSKLKERGGFTKFYVWDGKK